MEQRALDASGIIGQVEGPFEVSYNSRDLLAYALGIGCSSEQSSEFRFLYEGSPGFAAFPTYPLVLPYKGLSSDVVPFPGRTLFLIPRGFRDVVVDTGAILHYDQSIEMFQPLDPKGAELEAWSVVLGVYRKRGGVLLRTKTTLTDRKSGQTLAETTQGTFMRGLEVVGDAGPPLPPRSIPPTRPPDAMVAVTVSAQQALLYRLSGDYNAIHADPEAARAAGLDRPILHGLCSLGIAARQVLRFFCPEDPPGLLSLYCRFSRTVAPGDVLEVNMWGDVVSCAGGAGSREDSVAHKVRFAGGTAAGGRAGARAGAGAAKRKKVKGRHQGFCGRAVARRLEGEVGTGMSNDKQQHQERATLAAKATERTQHQVVRFDVRSPRQGGAVVVADGRAVVRRRFVGRGEGVVAGEGVLPNRARL